MHHKNYKKLFRKKIIVLFLGILLLAGFLRVYKLGSQSFIADEYIGINISYGYHKTGEWKYWDFNAGRLTDREYTRAKIYYWQVAQTFHFLEPTERNARLVSVLWGLAGIVAIFVVSFLITGNIYISLISSALLSISVSALMFDRKLRMYSMFAPIYFLFSYAVYQFFESKCYPNFLRRINYFSEKTNLNWHYLPLAILLGIVSLMTHLLAVNIVPTVLVYFVLMAVYLRKNPVKQKKYFWLLGISVLFIIIVSQTNTFHGAANFFEIGKSNWKYFQKITLDYSYGLLAFTFFIPGCVYLVKKHKKIGVWTILSFLVPLSMAILVWDRNAGHQYIYFTEPFKVIIIASGIYFAAKTISKKIFPNRRFVFGALVIYFILLLFNFQFFVSDKSFYQHPKRWSYSNYRQAYQYFLKKKSSNEVIMMRTFMSYNIRESNSAVLSYGRSDKLTLEKIKKAQEQYDGIWLINTDGEFNIKGSAKKFIKENFELIETKYTNDKVRIWHWSKNNQYNL
ncbi:MAG: hypothetical protein U9M90_01315 [Patescibacteria group bacterium]|nr:hypothetical protein [Patescibacteria group bacterium]